MKIVGFAGSNSIHSINLKLVKYAISYFDEHITEILDLNDFEMAIYSADRESDSGIPKEAEQFADKVIGADLILISFAEHNGSYSVAFKNIFDWVSRIKDREVWQGKKVFLLSTSPGGMGGKFVLKEAEGRLPRHGAEVLETFSLPDFHHSFSEVEGIIHSDKRRECEKKIASIKAASLSNNTEL